MPFEKIDEANKAYEELKAESEQYKTSVQKLQSKVDEVLGEKKTATQKAREAEQAAEAARLEALEKSGSLEEIKTAYEQRLAQEQEAFSGQLGQVKSFAKGQTVSGVLSIFDDKYRDLVKPHIDSKIDLVEENGKLTPIILDDDGKPSATSLQEFTQGLANNESFAPLLKGSQARGVGPVNTSSGGASGKSFNEMNGAELKELREKDPARYDALKSQRKF